MRYLIVLFTPSDKGKKWRSCCERESNSTKPIKRAQALPLHHTLASLLDLSRCFQPMLLQNALNPQQERKDCYFFCLCSVTGLYVIRKRRSLFQLLTVVHQLLFPLVRRRRQVQLNSFSLLLSQFVAQYVLIIVVQFFLKIYFSFREMTFLVRSLKYANFHREYYPSCVTSCNECTRPTVFL